MIELCASPHVPAMLVRRLVEVAPAIMTQQALMDIETLGRPAFTKPEHGQDVEAPQDRLTSVAESWPLPSGSREITLASLQAANRAITHLPSPGM